MKLQELLRVEKQVGDIGLEIEMEAANIPSAASVSEFWKVEHDQSLRGESAEFVLRVPLKKEGVYKALGNLKSAMKEHGTVFKDTYRAGVHVHINVQDLSPRQLITFIATYLTMEEVFLSFCDKSRVGNHFCLRLSDATYLLDMLTEAIVKSDLSLLNTEDLRYASLNLTSLFKYGSVEFRALESTTDFDKIALWAEMLYHIKEMSKTIASPTDILGGASEMGFEKFAKHILGPYQKVFSKSPVGDFVKKGIRNVQYAIYSRNWSAEHLNIFDKNISLFNS